MAALVLFDGVCNFCNGSVNFIIRNDPEGYFKFAALQSDEGRKAAESCGLSPALTGPSGESGELKQIDSVILIEEGKAYTHSTAALRIARRLRPPWPAAYLLVVIPRAIRDAFYRWFARNRYRIFGRRDSCMLPAPEVRARFLG